MGLSWAHVLGDPFAASTFINTWARIMAGQMPPQPLKLPNSTNTGECQFPPNSNSEKPFSLKRVDTVDDYWLVSSSCKMETLSFHFTARKLDQIASKASFRPKPVFSSPRRVDLEIASENKGRIRTEGCDNMQ